MPKINHVFFLLGSNINPRLGYIGKSAELIEEYIGKILCQSDLYESEPWGFEADTNFLNQVIEVHTVFSADEVHNKAQQIERQMGRKKGSGEGYSSRNIDIDLLYFNDEVIHTENLVIPHPRLHERKFTLMPMVEIAPEFIHPVFKVSQRELLSRCSDQGSVWLYQKVQA